jgi:hypothetical protein
MLRPEQSDECSSRSEVEETASRQGLKREKWTVQIIKPRILPHSRHRFAVRLCSK